MVKGALMMEPTETESKESLDRFVETMIEIAKEAEENPDLLRQAPQKGQGKKARRGPGGKKSEIEMEEGTGVNAG